MIPVDETTLAWWDATRQRRLTVQRCAACGHHQHHPRPVCLACGGPEPPLVDVTGAGVVETFTVVRRAPSPAFTAPYAVAVVALDEGPRLLSNAEPWPDVTVGARVQVRWRPLPDGRNLPVFVVV
ncbi:OB-fold domain-containing protein [Dactylosporangium sp. NBC_01737]|uniref:Zn-ribbon domain-containing OB-fold protein n=1 Tax=Dactylosporangium sp. NBC_01737 TaxID=2975959 RepID=UPI002E135417|nr:OB-fold domain-containing protein [Dactylosporangium sp. NBC_01737]